MCKHRTLDQLGENCLYRHFNSDILWPWHHPKSGVVPHADEAQLTFSNVLFSSYVAIAIDESGRKDDPGIFRGRDHGGAEQALQSSMSTHS